MDRFYQSSEQTGGGDDSDDDDDEESITSVDDTSDADEASSEDGNENWVFDRFLEKIDCHAEEVGGCTVQRRRELFRKVYIDYLVWNQSLKRNNIHKKIMETVKDFEANDYDKEEAFHAAVDQRKFLLDRIVDSQSTVVEEDGDDGDDEEDGV